MEDLIENTDFRTILEICMDLVSAIWEKKREDLLYNYNELTHIGKIGFFLEALVRDEKYEQIPINIFRKLAAMNGIYQIDRLIERYQENGEDPKISLSNEGVFLVKLKSYKEVVNLCEKIWKDYDKKGLLDDSQKNFIKVLISAIIPKKFEILNKEVKDEINLKKILDICKNLGLIIQKSSYYYTQTLFKNISSDTLDLFSEFDIASNKIIEEIEKINVSPAFPLESIDSRIQNAIIEGAFKGVLLPVPVILPNATTKYFLFTNPKDLENGDLSYETAAYFRFNEVYAVKNLGRLENPPAFLNKLVNNGTAGNATNIGLNYFPLEVKGVIKIVEGSTSNRKRMISLKSETLKESNEILNKSFDYSVGSVKNSPTWLSDAAGYRARFSNSEDIKNHCIDLKKLLRDYG
ncbi:MAG: hypothetical protein ACFFBP_01295 [Promethearchaeota archaeon]